MSNTHQLRSPAAYPAPTRTTASGSWSVERPGILVAVAVLGAVIAASGYFFIDWAAGLSFADVRQATAQDGSTVHVLTQVYARVAFLPLLLGGVITALCAPANHAVLRAAAGGAGVVAGLSMIGVLIWVVTGSVGTDQTRHGALPVLTVIALVGVAIAVLGAGTLFDTRGVLARSLAAAVAGLALVLHVYAIEDVLGNPDFGAWVGVLGYALLILSVALPHRRITHAR